MESFKEEKSFEELNERQKRFIQYFMETPIQTLAAKKAGYTQKNPHKYGIELYGKLKKYIEPELKKLENERIASVKEVLEFLTKVMRGKEKDISGKCPSLQERIECAKLLGKRYALFTDKIEKTTKDVKVVFSVPRPPLTESEKDGNNNKL